MLGHINEGENEHGTIAFVSVYQYLWALCNPLVLLAIVHISYISFSFKKFDFINRVEKNKFFNLVNMQKSIEKSYFFEEKFLLALVKDMQHFLHNHCFDIFLSSIFCGVHIAKSNLIKPLFNVQSVTIKDFYVRDTFR